MSDAPKQGRRAALFTEAKVANAAFELGAVVAAFGLGVVRAPALVFGVLVALAMLWWAWSRRGQLGQLAATSPLKLAGACAVGLGLNAAVNAGAYLAGRSLAAVFTGQP